MSASTSNEFDPTAELRALEDAQLGAAAGIRRTIRCVACQRRFDVAVCPSSRFYPYTCTLCRRTIPGEELRAIIAEIERVEQFRDRVRATFNNKSR